METYSSKDKDGDDSNEESLFLSIEEKDSERFGTLHDENINEISMTKKTTLHAKVEPKAWIFDSGCSNHVIGDIKKFIEFEKYDGGSIKFVGEA